MNNSAVANSPAKNKNSKAGYRSASILIGMICLLFTIIVPKLSQMQKPYGLGDYTQASIQENELQYLNSNDPKDLVELLKGQCFMVVVEKDESYEQDIEKYGTQLYDFVRYQGIDLSTLDKEENMMELLRCIKKYGAK